jgi:hypothetical protein
MPLAPETQGNTAQRSMDVIIGPVLVLVCAVIVPQIQQPRLSVVGVPVAPGRRVLLTVLCKAYQMFLAMGRVVLLAIERSLFAMGLIIRAIIGGAFLAILLTIRTLFGGKFFPTACSIGQVRRKAFRAVSGHVEYLLSSVRASVVVGSCEAMNSHRRCNAVLPNTLYPI